NNHPPKVTQPTIEVNNRSKSSASEEDTKSVYKEEELDDKLFGYSEEKEQPYHSHYRNKILLSYLDSDNKLIAS
ncbi:3012_t:CDS:1, partial [Dentiscutata heterogama]